MESPVAKKATRRWMRWISAGVRRERRSTRSVEKSTSSTVQVFLMPSLNMSKKTGYCMGLRVSERPGSRMESGALVDMGDSNSWLGKSGQTRLELGSKEPSKLFHVEQ